MAFSDSSSQLTTLTREIATLTATLQREKQRRAAIASHAKEEEQRAFTAEMKLKQVQYANKKLEEELNNIKENEAENRDYDKENAELKSQVAQLRADLIANQALQQELLQLHTASLTAPPPPPAPATAPVEPSFSFTSNNNHDVDAAMKEIAAIVPQYRASILALQGRIAVLNKQLEQTTAERDRLHRDVATWRDAAQRNESCLAEVSAKLHTQESASLASKTSSQQVAARLEAEVNSIKQQHAVVTAELKEARHAAQQAQQTVDSQQKLLETQSNTIARLETTVREQQEDIIGALDLVCHRVPQVPSTNLDKDGATASGGSDIDANLDFLDTLGVSIKKAAAGRGEGDNWTIAASGAGSGGENNINNLNLHGDDSLETWLHNPPSSKNPSSSPMKKGRGGGATAEAGKKIEKNRTNSLEMADLAHDIAALRDALQLVL